MARHWFKAKTYGWGWTPATWQGWVILLAYVLAVGASAIILLRPRFGVYGWIGYSTSIVLATALLILVCYKTGETPRWRWGKE